MIKVGGKAEHALSVPFDFTHFWHTRDGIPNFRDDTSMGQRVSREGGEVIMAAIKNNQFDVSLTPALPHGEIPFSPTEFYLVGLFFGLFSVSIMASMNWQRLNKPERIWLPIVVGIALFIGITLVGLITGVPVAVIGGAASILFTIWIVERQKAASQDWKAQFGTERPDQPGHYLRLVAISVSGLILNIVIWQVMLTVLERIL